MQRADVTLARAKCPRCGMVIVAASPTARDEMARAHDREVHGLTPPSSVEPNASNKPAKAPAVKP